MNFKLETQTPESIRAEKLKLAADERRQAMQAKADAQLSGTAGDLTADLFGEGETPLFNQRRNRK